VDALAGYENVGGPPGVVESGMLARTLLLAAVVSLASCARDRPAGAAREWGRDPLVAPHEFDQLAGAPWSGTLTYTDFTSGERTTIRSTLLVTRVGDGAWDFAIGYNDEPHANNKQRVALDDAGRFIRFGDRCEEVVRGSSPATPGPIETVADGDDNGRPAIIKHVYMISPKAFSIRKLVKPPGEPEFFERNIYEWTR
jgi:hypothetical protein